MGQSLQCPRCHWRGESDRAAGWSSRSCPDCRAPLVLAPGPAESLVRNYMHGRRLPPLRLTRSSSAAQ
jgi:hypothetical protein